MYFFPPFCFPFLSSPLPCPSPRLFFSPPRFVPFSERQRSRARSRLIVETISLARSSELDRPRCRISRCTANAILDNCESDRFRVASPTLTRPCSFPYEKTRVALQSQPKSPSVAELESVLRRRAGIYRDACEVCMRDVYGFCMKAPEVRRSEVDIVRTMSIYGDALAVNQERKSIFCYFVTSRLNFLTKCAHGRKYAVEGKKYFGSMERRHRGLLLIYAINSIKLSADFFRLYMLYRRNNILFWKQRKPSVLR